MKRILVFLISFFIAFSPVAVFASASGNLGAWSIGNIVAQGTSALVSATKNIVVDGKNVVKSSTALLTPKLADVSKLIGKGLAGVAVSVAVEQLLGAVDWVMDAENNQILYTRKCQITESSTCSDAQYFYKVENLPDEVFDSPNSACNAMIGKFNDNKVKYVYQNKGVTNVGSTIYCNFSVSLDGAVIDQSNRDIKKILNPDYDPDAVSEQKSIPLDAVAEQILSNAQKDDAEAKSAVVSVAQDMINEAEKDDAKARPIINELEANAKTQTEADANTATGQTKPNSETGETDLALEFPTFCGWASTVCEAAQVVITKPKEWANSISEAYTEVKEWFQKEPDLTNDEPLDIKQEKFDTYTRESHVIFASSCPFSPTAYSLDLGVGSINFTNDLTFICDFGNQARPYIQGFGYLGGLIYLLIGIRNNG